MATVDFDALRRRQPLLRGDRRVHPAPRPRRSQAACSGPRSTASSGWSSTTRSSASSRTPRSTRSRGPGCLDEYFRGKSAGDDIRAAFGELEPISPAYRDPERARRADGHAAARRAASCSRRSVSAWRRRCCTIPTRCTTCSTRSTSGCTTTGRSTTRTASSRRPYICLQDPDARRAEVEYALEHGAHVRRDALRSGARPGVLAARPATRCTTAMWARLAEAGHPRRVPLGRRGLRPLRRRVGRRRRLPGVPQRPVPQRHRRSPPDLRHDRRARVPRRVPPPPEPARRDDRERLRLGAAAAAGA